MATRTALLATAFTIGFVASTGFAAWEVRQPLVTVVPADAAKALPELGPAQAAAVGDLDGDGVLELVTGHHAGTLGALVVYRGNPDYRQGVRRDLWRVERGLPPIEPFQAEALAFELPFAPDWLAVGDLDADGDLDVVGAARGGWQLEWRRGDGRGHLGEPETVPLSGPVTAFVAGEVNRRDGLLDLVVAVGEGELLVFESPRGALGDAPEWIPVAATVTDLALGSLDDDGWRDIAAAAGDLVLVHGRDRMLGRSLARQRSVAAPAVEMVRLGGAAARLAVGRFADRPRAQLAVLREDGVVELVTATGGRVEHRAVGSLAAVGEVLPDLVAARTSGMAGADLVVGGAGKPVAVHGLDLGAGERARLGRRSTLPLAASGMLAVRLDRDARDEVVVLAGGVVPAVAKDSPLTVYPVTSVADPGNGVCDASCTLREAITAANAGPLGSSIVMDLPFGSVITPTSPLPALTKGGTTVDGTVTSGILTGKLMLDGSACGADCDGFTLAADGATVTDLVIGNFTAAGLLVSGDDNLVEGCWLGLETDSDPAVPNYHGLEVHGGSDNTIGGTTAAARNVISGNTSYGVEVNRESASIFPVGTILIGNFIGTNTVSTAAFANGSAGIHLYYSADTSIGQALPGAGNVLAGNTSDGLYMQVETAGYGPSLVVQNMVGIGADGATALGNGEYGIQVRAPSTIGGPGGGLTRNVFGNSFYPAIGLGSNSTGSVVQGNYVGVATDGVTPAPNGGGIQMSYAGGHTIGGTVANLANVVSGNAGNGIANNSTPSDIEVLGNLIGSDATGTIAVGNSGVGVRFQNCTNCSLGELNNSASRNIIVANSNGVVVNGGSGNVIDANRIGITASGAAAGNTTDGIAVSSSVGLTIGGLNIIAHSGQDGINIYLNGNGDPANVAIGGAKIHSNGSLGIDLLDNDVSLNDPGDGDTGPNNMQNFPVITSASPVTGEITATLDSDRANADYRIYFYSSASCDPSGYGEGESPLLQRRLTTDGNGQGTITVTAPTLSAGRWVTAFAVDPDGNTSEFSACFLAAAPGGEIFSDDFESGDTSGWSSVTP